MQSWHCEQATQPLQRRQDTQPTQAAHPLIRSDSAVTALPATAALPNVPTDPATATLPMVPIEPATAALPEVAIEPATAALPNVAIDPATATLPMVAIEAITAALAVVAIDSGASRALMSMAWILRLFRAEDSMSCADPLTGISVRAWLFVAALPYSAYTYVD